ncbi:MAG: 3-phenylpropionate/cinnamic acid dioxygenase subunit beta [Pseudomonadales bacterium]
MQHELIREVEQFLYREARLLDNRQFEQWLELFTEDVRYIMPSRSTRYPFVSRSVRIYDEDRVTEEELHGEDELAYFDENKLSLTSRIKRFGTGMAWAEDPPSRTRHLITNIEVEAGEQENEVTSYCNYLLYRNRSERDEAYYVGSRVDTLRKEEGAWRIAKRYITLDQNVVLSKNLSIFF